MCLDKHDSNVGTTQNAELFRVICAGFNGIKQTYFGVKKIWALAGKGNDTLDLRGVLAPVDAAIHPSAHATAWYCLHELARIRRGDKVLIHSATGGVGQAAVAIARAAGADIFATAGSPARRDLLRQWGIDHVYDSRSTAFADEIRADTAGYGVDIVLNSLPGAAQRAGLELLSFGGRFLEIGKRDIYGDIRLGLLPFRRNLSFHAVDLALLAKTFAMSEGLAARLDLPVLVAWCIGAGALRNLVWDHLHGIHPPREPADIDVLYYDDADLAKNTEQALEERLSALEPAPWQIRNQARMHLRNGDRPYASVEDAMRHWLETPTCVALALGHDDRFRVIAPFGLEDLFAMRIRPTPSLISPSKISPVIPRSSSSSRAGRWFITAGNTSS